MHCEKKSMQSSKILKKNKIPIYSFDLFGIEPDYGWYGLILPIIKEIYIYNEKHPNEKIHIIQIEEKFGSLRMHTTKAPDYIEAMISKAACASEHTCEKCGAKGIKYELDGWNQTLCEKHFIAKKDADMDDELCDFVYNIYLTNSN